MGCVHGESVIAHAICAPNLAKALDPSRKKTALKEFFMATLPNIPDLPTPITPDGSPPSEMPVEPDDGVGTMLSADAASIRIRSTGALKTGTHLHFMANRQFMSAAAFRWPGTSAPMRLN